MNDANRERLAGLLRQRLSDLGHAGPKLESEIEKQVKLHAQLTDDHEAAHIAYSEAKGELDVWRRDAKEAIDVEYDEKFGAVHATYEAASHKAHTRAVKAGIVFIDRE